MNSIHTPPPPNTRSGFTLIELLVVITIIGVLAGISLPVYQRAMTNARRVKGISNLRNAGTAIMSYAADNSSILPGPCGLEVIPTYKKSSKTDGDLAGFIAPYLGLAEASKLTGSGYVLIPALVSPGMAAASPTFVQTTSRIPHYIQSDVLKGQDATGTGTIRPFGYTADPPTDPIRLTQLGDLTDLNGKTLSSVQVWLLTDVDQQSTDPQAKVSSWFTSLPKTPVYGSSRLRIYADGHAAAAPLDE